MLKRWKSENSEIIVAEIEEKEDENDADVSVILLILIETIRDKNKNSAKLKIMIDMCCEKDNEVEKCEKKFLEESVLTSLLLIEE